MVSFIKYYYLLLSITFALDGTCDEPLGLDYWLPESRQVADDQLSASSSANRYSLPQYGRLHMKGS